MLHLLGELRNRRRLTLHLLRQLHRLFERQPPESRLKCTSRMVSAQRYSVAEPIRYDRVHALQMFSPDYEDESLKLA